MIGKLTYDETEEVLRNNILGRIGCNDGDKTYIVPISYVYDGKFILAHSLDGMKVEMMRKNPRICFEVDEIKGINNWKSVILWGEYQELATERERYHAMKLFTEKLIQLKTAKPHVQHDTVVPEDNKRPVIYRIVIMHRTGRFENQ